MIDLIGLVKEEATSPLYRTHTFSDMQMNISFSSP